MVMNKRKTTTAIIAGVTALALTLGGTFAWTSISQQAKNEAAGIVNVGGRLHDDFNGENKDIYVENFTDPLNGGQPIYARVKLTEYMEVGQDAGGGDVDGDGIFDEAVPVINGTSRTDVTTWTPHVPETDCAVCKTEGTCKIHDHWAWTMGGKTTYMPTFNKDKDSLDADINGTYAGTDKTDKVYYDDYVVYTMEDTGAKNVAFAEKEKTEGAIYSVIGTEYYDDDTDTAVNTAAGQYRTVENVTHTAKETVDSTVITMAAWKAAGSKAGNFWVYDTDGWAYWANPIMPGESTGLLLNSIAMTKNPGERCYYSINVIGQFATVNDWELFGVDENDPDYPSDDALKLLSTAANNVTVVTVQNDSNITTVEAGATVNFSATASVGGTKNENATFDWAVYDADLKPVTTSTIANGILTVGATETNANLIIAATDKDSGAVGLSSIAVKMETTHTVDFGNEVAIIGSNDKTGIALTLKNAEGEEITEGVTWSVSSTNATVENNYLKASENAALTNAIDQYTVTAYVDGKSVGNANFYMSNAAKHIFSIRSVNIVSLNSGNTYVFFDPVASTYIEMGTVIGCVWKFGDSVDNIYTYEHEMNATMEGLAEYIENRIYNPYYDESTDNQSERFKYEKCQH